MPLLVLLAQAADMSPADIMAAYRERTAAETHCVYADTTDITVCGRRSADRFRAPFASARDPGATTADNAAAERTALLHRTTPIQDLSPFLVGGGLAGVTASTSFGPGAGGSHVGGYRPPAP